MRSFSLSLLSTLALLACSSLVMGADSKPPYPPYPLTTCVVSGDKLGEMGKPVVLNYQGTEVRFCCKDCIKTFKKNPEKYLAKLKAAAK